MQRYPRYDLIAIGDVTVDVFLQLHDASLVCHLNTEDCLLCIEYAEKVPVEQMTEVLGVGNAANNAVGSARLGLRTALWTILGDDAVGHRTVTEVLQAEGVATPFVVHDKKHGTNYSTVINFQTERTILVYHQPRAYRFPRLPPSSWVYFTSMGRGWEVVSTPLVAHVRRTGARLAFNPGTHQLKAGAGVLAPILNVTDVLFVNVDEAQRILVTKDRDAKTLLKGLHHLGPKTVVMTDGPQGAFASAKESMWYMPTVPAPVVERTGAGDSFATGVVAALFSGEPLPEALRWGAGNASSVVQYIGSREGLLTKRTLQRLLQKHKTVVARKL